MNQHDRLAVALYVCVSVALGFTDFYVRRYPEHVLTAYIPGVLNGTYEAPFIYRPLAPFFIHTFNQITGLTPIVGFLLIRQAFILAALLVLHAYLRLWYSSQASLGGTSAAAALLPLTFTNSWQHPDSFPELFLFTLGCMAVASRRDGAFFVIVALASLNRESAVFLVAIWILYRVPEDFSVRTLAHGLGYAFIVLGILAGMRWLRGVKHYQYFMLSRNLQLLDLTAADVNPRLRVIAYFWLVLVGVPGWLAVRGALRRPAPRFFRCTLPIAVAFLITSFSFASVIEPRVLLPLFPLLLPPALHVFAEVEPRPEPVP